MRLAVMGAKKFKSEEYIQAVLNDYLPNIKVLVTALEQGTCQTALTFTKEYNEVVKYQDLGSQVTTLAFELDLDYPYDEALNKRNQNILNTADISLVFWDNLDEEVRNFINQAVKQNKHLIIHCIPNDK